MDKEKHPVDPPQDEESLRSWLFGDDEEDEDSVPRFGPN
jgi:hypothetical protein